MKLLWNLHKTMMGLLIVAALINIMFVIGIRKYLRVSLLSVKDDSFPNETDESSTPQIQKVITYDFNMHARYRLQLLRAEMDKLITTEPCASVLRNPLSYWRSQSSSKTNFTTDIDLERLNEAVRCPVIPMPDFIRTPPLPTQYSFEIPYLQAPPLTDILKVSNESTSGVVLFNSSSTFVIGDTVALFITVRDGRGNPKTKGGDEIRAWFTDVLSSNSTLPAKITDFNNGTYLATAVLAFVGTFRAQVTLVHSREFLQTLIIDRLLYKSSIFYLGAFRNKQASEATLCYHVPVIPGRNHSQICNVTGFNGTPWFCGRPVKPWLQCSDYAETRKLSRSLTMPMNEAEKLLIMRVNKMIITPGSSNITFNVTVRPNTNNLTRLASSEECSRISPRQTWEQPEPTGYFFQGLWHYYFCRRPERVNNTCLRNIHIIIMGDSNGRQLYEDISPISSCRELIFKEYKSWHKPLKCVREDLNFTLEWIPHSNPFLTGHVQWAGHDWIKGSNKVIDEVPSTGRYLIHLINYLHYTTCHISAFVNMMVAVKESIVRLVKRNPDVTVVLQGPFVVWNLGARNTYESGDTLRRFITLVQFELFQDLRDHVYYLQTSDLTIAAQNSPFHPADNWQISNMMTGFVCGRQ